MKKTITIFLAGAMLLLATSAMAIPYGFTQLASSASSSSVASQLSVDVTGSGSNTLFKFTNTGSLASVIAAIYFDYGTPSPITYVGMTDSGLNVEFEVGATPPNLPGWETISFISGWKTDANSPAPTYGINNTADSAEWLSIEFSGLSLSQIIADLNDNTLRIGLHVQSQADGKSAEYVSGAAPVPEPGTMMLLGAGLLSLAVFGKRRMK